MHIRPPQPAEPAFVELAVVGVEGDEHLLGHAEGRRLGVEPLDDVADELGVGDVLHLVDNEALAPDDPALAHIEDLHRRFQLVVGDADDVDILGALGDDRLLLDGLAHTRQPVTQAGGPLELEEAGRLLHLLLEAADDGLGVAVEELDELVDQVVVLLLLDGADTRGAALFDVAQKAGPADAVVVGVLVVRAGTDREGA